MLKKICVSFLVIGMILASWAFDAKAGSPVTNWMIGVSGSYLYPSNGLSEFKNGFSMEGELWYKFSDNIAAKIDGGLNQIDSLDLVGVGANLCYFAYDINVIRKFNPYVALGIGYGEVRPGGNYDVDVTPKKIETGVFYRWSDLLWFHAKLAQTSWGTDENFYGSKTVYNFGVGLLYKFDFRVDK